MVLGVPNEPGAGEEVYDKAPITRPFFMPPYLK
jgi:hypothetical protein